MTTESPLFIAVHVGAGRLSRKKEHSYKQACERACEAAMRVLKSSMGNAMDAVTEAVITLENDCVTNAGFGSNLSLHGKVECDASIMDGRDGSFGAVGATRDFRNPIIIARHMAEEDRKGRMLLGRIPPLLLVGKGVKQWAKEHGLSQHIVNNETLVSYDANVNYVKYLTSLCDAVAEKNGIADNSQDTSQKMETDASSEDLRQDTVGAICIDADGNIASAVSSGGIALKYRGRVGEAAVYGSGCWATNPENNTPGIACSTSGTGEQITRTMLTTKIVARLSTEDDTRSTLEEVMKKEFLESPLLRRYGEKAAGVIILRAEREEDTSQVTHLEFWFAHVTESMGIGYMSGASEKPKAFVSRKSSSQPIVIGGWPVRS